MQPYANKTQAGICRAARRLARKKVARELRLEQKARTAKTFPTAGQGPSWDKLMATALFYRHMSPLVYLMLISQGRVRAKASH